MSQRPTRILYVQPNNGVGGSDIALLRLVRSLDRARWTPVVALPHEGPLSALLTEAGAELRYAPMRQLRTRLWRELDTNLGLRVEDTDTAERWLVSGRGELTRHTSTGCAGADLFLLLKVRA